MTFIAKHHITDFIGGWFIGDFEPSILKTKDFEVSIKTHLQDEQWPHHYHKEATEFNYVFSGKVKIEDVVYEAGDIFVIYPEYIVRPEFLEDCTILCVKTPSKIGDKYEVDRS